MLQPSAKDEQMECEGTEATAVQVKAYSRPLVSPDAYSGSDCVERLAPEVKTEYATAKEALEKRFEPESKRTLYFVEFQAKGRKKEETWSDFADELRVLADKALPDVEDKAKEILTIERFLSELTNPQSRIQTLIPTAADGLHHRYEGLGTRLHAGDRIIPLAKDTRVAAVTPLVPSPESASLAAVREEETLHKLLQSLSLRMESWKKQWIVVWHLQVGRRSHGLDTLEGMIQVESIIGLDFLEAHHCIIDLPNKLLQFRGVSVPLERHQYSDDSQQIPTEPREDAPDVSPRKSIMLQEMVERIASDLTPDEKEKMYQLLRVPPARREQARGLVKDMLQKNIIQPSSSPWASPVVLVGKKDSSLRFCVDYRKLNAITRKDAYPLPRVDDSLEALSGSRWFSTLDLLSGYWQVEIDEKARPKTAFTTGEGLFEFRVMPFELWNAPAVFQRLMDLVLSGIRWDHCLVYIDDIIITGKMFEDHLKNLRIVLERLKGAGRD
eukprot:Em0003g1617a